MQISIFYGSTTGMTEAVAQTLGEKLNTQEVFPVGNMTDASLEAADVLILGSSTWGSGDLQDDWFDGVEVLRAGNLAGKKVAVFGCGDGEGFGDTFCNALGQIAEAAKEAGATLIGQVSPEGYTYEESESIVDGMFVGLPLDETNEPDKTEERVDAWVEILKAEF